MWRASRRRWALRDQAPEEAEVVLVAPAPDLVLKPLVVEEPFTHRPPERHDLKPMLERVGARYVSGAVHRVDAEDHTVRLRSGTGMPYDILLACMGGRVRSGYHKAETFWSTTGDLPADRLIGGRISLLRTDAGSRGSARSQLDAAAL